MAAAARVKPNQFARMATMAVADNGLLDLNNRLKCIEEVLIRLRMDVIHANFLPVTRANNYNFSCRGFYVIRKTPATCYPAKIVNAIPCFCPYEIVYLHSIKDGVRVLFETILFVFVFNTSSLDVIFFGFWFWRKRAANSQYLSDNAALCVIALSGFQVNSPKLHSCLLLNLTSEYFVPSKG
jgi:hypothetical protein